MKKLIVASSVLFLICLTIAPAFAQSKPCEELKTEIAAKIDAKGATGYQLEIVKTEEVKEQVVVGSCEGGTKKITYTQSAQASPKAEATKTESKPKPTAAKPQ